MTPEPDAVRVEVNERGTPFLYYPDSDDHGGVGESWREATVAEAAFWREVERLREALAVLEGRQSDLVNAARVLLEIMYEAGPPDETTEQMEERTQARAQEAAGRLAQLVGVQVRP